MDDRNLVAALRSGDAHSLAAVHDAFADKLYDYALGMLRDREAAEDAVHDALLVAIGRIRLLREPRRATAWLYALTRNECLRQSRRSRMASRASLADSRDETVFFGVADLRAEQARAWIRDAASGLAAHRREVLDLTVRHGVTEADLATVIGAGARRAARRVRAARADLDRALDSLLIARAGHGDCAELDSLLAGWDGLFTRAVHQRVSAHATNCRTCAAGASGRGAATARFAELPRTPAAPSLRDRLLGTASIPDRIVYRGEIAEPFLRSGFPVPLDSARRHRRVAVWGAAAATAVLLVGGLLYLMQPDTVEPQRNNAETTTGIEPVGSTPASPSSVSPTNSGSASPSPSVSPSPSASPSAPARPSPSPGPTRPGGGSDPNIQVDALLADSTLGCPQDWRATVTANVRGRDVRQATFLWGETSSPSNEVRMARVNDGIYQRDVGGLPMNVTVYWRVVVTTRAGLTSSTGVNTARHTRQC